VVRERGTRDVGGILTRPGPGRTRAQAPVSARPAPMIAPESLANPEIFCRLFAPVCDDLVAYLGALIEGRQAGFLDSRNVHEYVLAAAVRLNKTKALGRVEPFNCTDRHVRSPFEVIRAA
jgi:hypothetical protein